MLVALRAAETPMFQELCYLASPLVNGILQHRSGSADVLVRAVDQARNLGVGGLLHDVLAAIKIANKIQQAHGMQDLPWGPEDEEELVEAQQVWKV